MNSWVKSLLRRLMPRTIHCHRIWTGPLRGQQIVASWHNYPAAILGLTELPLLDWFSRNVHLGETWLDVGAHYGYTAIALSRLVGPQGRVFAFEPMLSTVGCLAQTRRLNDLPQLVVLPFALATPAGSLELRQLPTVRGMVDSTKRDGQCTETILVTRLDWLWPQVCDCQERIDGIKIDVQGMEIEALRGMFDLLKAFKPKLVIEVHHGVVRNELLELVEAVGYLRRGVPIEPIGGEVEPQYVDDRSYVFKSV